MTHIYDEAAAPAPSAPYRLDYLEGIRALAALWVVLSHLWIYQFGMFTNTGVVGDFSNWLLYSHLAVDVFIVLSGYCLALPLVRDGGLKGGMWTFYKRRARRILPPYYIALILSIVILALSNKAALGHWHLDFHAMAINFLLFQDIHLNSDIFDGPLWSVAVECRIYLLFPLLVWLLKKYGTAVLLAAAVIGYGATLYIFQYRPSALLACPWYLLLFAFGMCAAVGAKREAWLHIVNRWREIALLAALALSALLAKFPILPNDDVIFGLHMPVIDAAAGALVAALLVGLSPGAPKQWTAGRKFLSGRPLVALGKVSYSLYLTHFPTLTLIAWLILPHLIPASAAPLIKLAIMTAISLPLILVFAYLFFVLCERPFMNSRQRKEHGVAKSPRDAVAITP